MLKERKKKITKIFESINFENFDDAIILFDEVFKGGSDKNSDPGMQGSLLYHMAMVNKMNTESRIILEELEIETPSVEKQVIEFYKDFISDSRELLKGILKLDNKTNIIIKSPILRSGEKINLFKQLEEKTSKVQDMVKKHDKNSKNAIEKLFYEWSNYIVDMRLRQEYETIRSFLILEKLAEDLGVKRIEQIMKCVGKKFGDKTVSSAFNVSLELSLPKEKLQKLMLSDHFIDYEMDMKNLGGFMQFLNCPIYGSHQYIETKQGKKSKTGQFFCMNFCKAHAQSMFEKFIPFPVAVTQSQRMISNEKCEYEIKLAPNLNIKPTQEKFIPLVISWNVTLKCNLKCAHCYINAEKSKIPDELSTDGAKMLIHQITEVSRPLLILSGGEPLLRDDIFEIIRYGKERGLRMGMGSNGMLIDDKVAMKLKDAGMWTVAISLDSSVPKRHDEFRGVKGCWKRAVNAIKELKKVGIEVQVNCTVTQENYDEIEKIMELAENLGVDNFHLFFLVPTGRGTNVKDITPKMYEEMINRTLSKTKKFKLNVKPSCAPQFMRVAKDQKINMSRWVRGCMAGLYYSLMFPRLIGIYGQGVTSPEG